MENGLGGASSPQGLRVEGVTQEVGSPNVTLLVNAPCFPGVPCKARWRLFSQPIVPKGLLAVRCGHKRRGYTPWREYTFGKWLRHNALEFSDTTKCNSSFTLHVKNNS